MNRPPSPATLSEDAAHYIACAQLQTPGAELSFRAAWDAERRQVISPTLVFRGRPTTCRQPVSQFAYGSIALHTHPHGSPALPSTGDLDAAALLAGHGVAFGIVTADASALYMVTEPGMVAPPPLSAKAEADYYGGRRRWTLGRWSLELLPRLRYVTFHY